MALRPPSLSKLYDTFYSGDPALLQLADGADEETRKSYESTIRVARETGQIGPLVVPGEMPTIFKLRAIPGELYREMMDRLRGVRVGPGRLNAMLFRAAVRGVANLRDPDGVEIAVELVPNPIADLREHGLIASPEIVDYLDALDVRIVTELGELALERAMHIAPKL